MAHVKNVLLSKFLNVGIINQGEFTLKSGAKSNFYLDFRKLINYPQFFKYLELITDQEFPHLLSAQENLRLLPVPMGGIPFGNFLAFQKAIPFLMVRDKPKDHGMGNIVEGDYKEGEDVVIIEDVISTGKSIREMLANLEKHGFGHMKFKAILTICNRGGVDEVNGIPVLSLFRLEEIMSLVINDPKSKVYFKNGSDKANLLYSAALQKKSNIIISCDFMSLDQVIDVVTKAADHIVGVKLHLDTLVASDTMSMESFFMLMKKLSVDRNLFLLDDAKLADIESIDIEKIKGCGLRCDATTLHAVAGLSILETPADVGDFVVVAEMSSRENLLGDAYTRQVVGIVQTTASKSRMLGFVCQTLVPQLLSDPFEFLTMSPGVSLDAGLVTDAGNQQYANPIKRKVGLFWIVGRAITKSAEIITAAAQYQKQGFMYFLRY